MKKKVKNRLQITNEKLTTGLAGFTICRSSFVVILLLFLVIGGCSREKKDLAGEQLTITEDIAKSAKSPNEVVVATIKTIHPEFTFHAFSIEATGLVTYDTRRMNTIPARVGGRLEKVYLKYPFQAVGKGQKVAEIYSPELLTAQRELLYLLENDVENEPLILASKHKLRLLGLTDLQIEDLIRRRAVQNAFAIFSPYTGYVITNETAPSLPSSTAPPPADQSGGMNKMSASPANSSNQQTLSTMAGSSALLPREGSYVSPGQSLFTIVNRDALRIELNLTGARAGTVKEGEKVELVFSDNQKDNATIDFVQPFFEEGENFLKIRVYTHNTSDLHIAQLVKAKINLAPKESLWLPRQAVVDLGTGKVVFLKDRGVLKPKTIITGIETGEWIEIVSGLATMDEVAANAQYLVDSESFIKPVN